MCQLFSLIAYHFLSCPFSYYRTYLYTFRVYASVSNVSYTPTLLFYTTYDMMFFVLHQTCFTAESVHCYTHRPYSRRVTEWMECDVVIHPPPSVYQSVWVEATQQRQLVIPLLFHAREKTCLFTVLDQFTCIFTVCDRHIYSIAFSIKTIIFNDDCNG